MKEDNSEKEVLELKFPEVYIVKDKLKRKSKEVKNGKKR